MKKLWKILANHVKEDFNFLIYGYVVVFLSILTFFNYYDVFNMGFTDNWEDDILDLNFGTNIGMLYYSLLNLFGYYMVAIPILLFRKKYEVLKNYKFWLKSLFVLFLFGIERGFYFHKEYIYRLNDYIEIYYANKIYSNAEGIVFYILVFFIFKMLFDRKVEGLYGMRIKNGHFKTFFALSLIVLPLTFAASFDESFLRSYPTIKPWMWDNIFGMNDWQYMVVYEFFYLFDFINVELLFRGFLVVGMARLLGKDAILPMVSLYVIIHFGKPMGETISSFFGGYILGVLAFRLKNIWGGCILHVSLALMMEIFALLQYYYIR